VAHDERNSANHLNDYLSIYGIYIEPLQVTLHVEMQEGPTVLAKLSADMALEQMLKQMLKLYRKCSIIRGVISEI